MSSFFDRGRFRHFSNILVKFLLRVLYKTNILPGNVRNAKTTRNRLRMELFRIILKRSREKSNRKKQRNSSTLLWKKTVCWKILLKKMLKITTKNSPASLTVAIDGAADLPVRNLPLREKFHWRDNKDVIVKLAGILLVVISDTFYSKTFQKLSSVPITCCCNSFSSGCFFPLLLLPITRKQDISNITF